MACSVWRIVAAQGAPSARPWQFVVSGDARDCGDIVVHGIARTARRNRAAFYWHLGDLRRTFGRDQDMLHQPEHIETPLSIDDYHAIEWQDFIDNQIAAFGSIPYLVGIGNHDVITPKTRDEFVATFAPWLDTPALRAQRLLDDPDDEVVKPYYRWIDRGISFYSLDNASNEQFDEAQLTWFEGVLARDIADPSITAIVAGMHKPLPDGYNRDHSMNESPTSTETGRRVYADLLRAQNDGGKRVYVLASHQHFYMADAYDSPYWRDNGGVLPGWVIGTAGAERYPLPIPSPKDATTNVYGSLLATVLPDGEIRFKFQRVDEGHIPSEVKKRYGQDFVHWCFESNSLAKPRRVAAPPPRP